MNLSLKSQNKYTVLLVVLILCFISFSAENVSRSTENSQINLLHAATELDFNETNAYNHISTQLDFGFRVPGTVEHDNCGDWIANQISSSVDEVLLHNFTIQKESQPSYNCQNILGKMNTEKNNIVTLAAHWDSRNVAEKDIVNQSLPIPGANDGASGVGVLIELARTLNLYKEFLDCEIWFLFLDAEDQGSSGGVYGLEGWDWAEGAQSFADSIDSYYEPNEEMECFILLDMVGGFDVQFVKESRSNPDLFSAIFNEGQNLGYEVAFPSNPKVMSITDDHLPFYELNIPVIDLIIDFVGGNWTYHHTHGDNIDHIDAESLKIVGETVESFIKNYYTVGDNLNWQSEGFFSNNINIIIVSGAVVLGVFLINYISRKRRR